MAASQHESINSGDFLYISVSMKVADLAYRLVDIPSLTGQEAAMLLALEDFFSELGLPCERQTVSDERWNLFVNWESHADVVFSTHVDTVPPHFPPDLREGKLYGRGACDTKGIIAAMLIAVEQLMQEGKRPSCLFVVGEETDSIGAKTAAMSGRTARYIIVGEPTENLLARGHKGVLSYTLQTEGVAAHSAYPELGSSAVHTLLDVLDDIRRHDWGSSPILGEATTNVGLITGGVALNVFAPSASATVMHRIVDDAERRKAEIESIVATRAAVQFHSVSQPQILETVDGFPLVTVGFGTDVPYLKAIGPCLLMGPGSIHQAHTADEYISVEEMEEAVLLYKKLYDELLKR